MRALHRVEFQVEAVEITVSVHSRPEGAKTNQPRAERSAALGQEINNMPSPEGAAQKWNCRAPSGLCVSKSFIPRATLCG